MHRFVVTLLLLTFWTNSAIAKDDVVLTSEDGVTITADVYRVHTAADAPWIVLAHQAQASRGEYLTIAPRLNKLGFNAIALDQRSGSGFANVKNETAAQAKSLGKKTNYLAAQPDLRAGIAWARSQTSGRVILWGSSYSAALALLMAGEKPRLVDGVIAMSPGEYLRGKSIASAAARIEVPVLIASPTKEAAQWRKIFKAIPHDQKQGFKPASGGVHGSSALIPARNKSSEDYWRVVTDFLKRHLL